MCSAPKVKTPKVQDIPLRQAVLLPDNGDPAVRAGLKGQRRLTTSAMIFANRGGSLGAPSVSGPIGTSGM
jgi:hypothetical protein